MMPGEEKKDGKQHGLWAVFKGECVKFLSESTIPGFKYIVQGHSLFERVTWTVFVVIAFCYAWQTISHQFIAWEKNPVETTIDEVGLPVHELPFPAITVCDTPSLKMPRKNRWMFVEQLLNSLQLVDPETELKRMYPGRWLLTPNLI